ncbi:MAG TPA: MmcQ/YjbR family DNA-binding protein [Ktedonobacterales bacterium]|nr:MmcQ/YjbR family DNA-binding protein [Ktedonobacterales bacterium]
MEKRLPVTFETVRDIALTYPGVEEGMSFGTPALRVRGKFMARLREDGETLVIKASETEREFRMTVDPATFFITEHYRGYSAVLVRLARVSVEDLADLIEQSWRWLAPRKLVAEYERAHPGQPATFSFGEIE